ncbi:MAG: hypothetical protein JNK45_15005 [Myxococcales bacterium]|jgi:hypothetical protein|nr:hypothetical protein [Myxococcales bacterium]
MAKYTIIYKTGPNGESNDAALNLINEVSNPPPTDPFSVYKHNGRIVLEISTADEDAALIISPPTGASLTDQNVKARLGVQVGERTTSTWKAAGAGMRLELFSDADSTTFDITADKLPPQALRVIVKRPTL